MKNVSATCYFCHAAHKVALKRILSRCHKCVKMLLAPAELSFNRTERHVYSQQYCCNPTPRQRAASASLVKQSSHFFRAHKNS